MGSASAMMSEMLTVDNVFIDQEDRRQLTGAFVAGMQYKII